MHLLTFAIPSRARTPAKSGMKGRAQQGIVACTPWDGEYGPMFLMSDETGSRVQMTVGPYEAQARFATKPPSGAGPKPTIDIALGAKRAYMKVTDGQGKPRCSNRTPCTESLRIRSLPIQEALKSRTWSPNNRMQLTRSARCEIGSRRPRS